MTGKTIYIEALSGISGDMTVAALLDLGADENILRSALYSLNLEGCQVEIRRVQKNGIGACDFHVILDEAHENHDHDMSYLHGEHEHHHHGEHEHHHGHEHSHESHHEHRGLSEIVTILNHSKMSHRAKELSCRIFEILAEAEAQAHDTTKEQVHFHEVGAVDSIMDIAAVAVCLDNLNVQNVIMTHLNEGNGMIRCQHGLIPVPVPAVVNIAKKHGLVLHITNVDGELVTPTGAAIAAAICTDSKLPEKFVIKKVGIGAGKREYRCPGILRIMEIEEDEETLSDPLLHRTADEQEPAGMQQMDDGQCVCCLEANIDDSTGEMLGFALDRLLEKGARDVFYHPVFMKKNRPAYQLNVICNEEDISKMEEIIFAHTTTIGIRRQKMQRTMLERSIRQVDTPLGKAAVKICTLPDGNIRCYPEYASVAELSMQHKKAFQEVYHMIWQAAGKAFV